MTLHRYDRTQAFLSASLTGARYTLHWMAQRREVLDDLNASFRAAFPRHGDATFSPKEHRWHVPARHQRRLEAWVAQNFALDARNADGPFGAAALVERPPHPGPRATDLLSFEPVPCILDRRPAAVPGPVGLCTSADDDGGGLPGRDVRADPLSDHAPKHGGEG